VSRIVVFGLGAAGVNLVKSPLQMDDSEVVSAQNAEPYRDRGDDRYQEAAGVSAR
jgi:hypothetical protein